MAQDNSAANSDKIHKDNSAQIAAQTAANAAKAAAVPSPVGRPNTPAMDLNAMQGTANGVVPNRVTLAR